MVARKSIIGSTADGGLGFKDFCLLGYTSRLAALASILVLFSFEIFLWFPAATLRPEWWDLARHSLLSYIRGCWSFYLLLFSEQFHFCHPCFLFFCIA